jgi:hypothetical protein
MLAVTLWLHLEWGSKSRGEDEADDKADALWLIESRISKNRLVLDDNSTLREGIDTSL